MKIRLLRISVIASLLFSGSAFAGDYVWSVSYTHLDVYKRQPPVSATWFSMASTHNSAAPENSGAALFEEGEGGELDTDTA